MDAKVTLSFNKNTIEAAKKFAEDKGMSLSRLTEFLYSRVLMNPNDSLEEMPISDWVYIVSEGLAEYKPGNSISTRRKLKAEYYKSKHR
jgi:hypothetical protein